MKKLLKKIKTEPDYDMFCKILSDRIKENNPISENPMIDGMVISFILTTSFSKDLFLQRNMGKVLDGTIQKLEQIIIWCSNNEDKLCNIFKTKNYGKTK